MSTRSLLGAQETSWSFFFPHFLAPFLLLFFPHLLGFGVFMGVKASCHLAIQKALTSNPNASYSAPGHAGEVRESFLLLRRSQNIPASLRKAMLMTEINAWKFWETRAEFAAPCVQLLMVKPGLFSPSVLPLCLFLLPLHQWLPFAGSASAPCRCGGIRHARRRSLKLEVI